MAIPDGSDVRTAATSSGFVRYRDTGGGGAPVLLIHSLLLDPDLYRAVVPRLVAAGYRCLLPELPLGGHRLALDRDADRTPLGLARLIVEVLDHAGVETVAVVGVDTGGALAQLLMAHHRDRVGSVVLTGCDAYEEFPPHSLLARLFSLAFTRSTIGMTARLLQTRVGRRALTMKPISHRRIDDSLLVQWTACLKDNRIREDLRLAFAGMHGRYTLDAAERNRDFPHPVLIAWGDDDRLFRRRLAVRLEQDLPGGRLITLEDCGAFAAVDQPERLAELIHAHLCASIDNGLPTGDPASGER
jgi:pimeloyl-ACP methyl ester carboxylesterase